MYTNTHEIRGYRLIAVHHNRRCPVYIVMWPVEGLGTLTIVHKLLEQVLVMFDVLMTAGSSRKIKPIPS